MPKLSCFKRCFIRFLSLSSSLSGFSQSRALVSVILNFAAAAPIAYVFDWTRKRSLKEKRKHRRAELREQKVNKR
jgi:hypothetical protein